MSSKQLNAVLALMVAVLLIIIIVMTSIPKAVSTDPMAQNLPLTATASQKTDPSVAALQEELQKTQDELLQNKVKFAIYQWTPGQEAFMNPAVKNKYYFMGHEDATGQHIWLYDLEQDVTFQETGIFNVGASNQLLYSEPLVEGKELRPLGLEGTQFVFYETAKADSPGPCFSPWLGAYHLTFIDVSSPNPVKKPYVAPAAKIASEKEEEAKCVKEFKAY